MREVGMRHLEQNEQGIDHGKLSTDEGSGRDMGAGGELEALGGPRGTKTQQYWLSNHSHLVHLAPKGNCRRPERAGTETLP